ncbi:8222_t:CDS:2 [Diversispora eburnea]|uniref:8222_t:CDS:1 n=1 Tax=Diversispora eburnea TaxID=1213867 RepID=A0A9N9EZA7_9GLOM|nr:8222_t:CDS:2 [Diversispora eburnea]
MLSLLALDYTLTMVVTPQYAQFGRCRLSGNKYLGDDGEERDEYEEEEVLLGGGRTIEVIEYIILI